MHTRLVGRKEVGCPCQTGHPPSSYAYAPMLDARSPTWTTSESRSPWPGTPPMDSHSPSRVWPPIRSPTRHIFRVHPPSPSSLDSHLSSHPARRTSPVSSSPISAPSLAHPLSWSRGTHVFPDRPWPARPRYGVPGWVQIPQIQEAASANALLRQCCNGCNAELARGAAVMLRLFLARFQRAPGPGSACPSQRGAEKNCAFCVEMCRWRRAQHLQPTCSFCTAYCLSSASDEPGSSPGFVRLAPGALPIPTLPLAPPTPAKPGVEG